MNVKNLLTLSGVIFALYGVWFFLAPDHAASVYGYSDAVTDLSTLLLKFLGVFLFAAGVMSFAARTAQKSIGRTAVLLFLAVSNILALIMNVMSVVAGAEGTMGIVDLVVNIVVGLGAVYFIIQDRNAE